MGKLEGKIAVVTGGNSGIGLATAKRFVAEGAKVYITGRRANDLDRAVREIGENVTAFQGDVSVLADLDRLYKLVKDEAGRVDIVFANAGGGEFSPLGDISEEHFDKTFAANVKGVLFTVQKALPLMGQGGSIILTGSTTSITGTPAFSVYSATKAAIRNFVRSWILDLRGRKIRVNVLSPGATKTPGLLGLAPAGQEQELLDGFAKDIPLGRVGDAEEIASVAVFLASDDSSYITGIELFVDGGSAQI
ncbi:NAD(P)-dependent dehydrogenase (short-subunit alcohol dehydrogenase family) [Granulicella aggregans]|uniref:NAD(P)-dependent dehydrogenase (Short-subunit alcohol dehydrogenase family) n=1 Tax=Granulicella aggregans TaxID=474949 RepID=A0A7W7ZJ98_9BACT|nr:glucose 1-dehydrogenase [Granulicella aggregans]MBB5060908.1 NAD(P)-dependent dehydrogenase (short-subunit alcohol dehydrogenase family) [Granulicella aggregans]